MSRAKQHGGLGRVAYLGRERQREVGGPGAEGILSAVSGLKV